MRAAPKRISASLHSPAFDRYHDRSLRMACLSVWLVFRFWKASLQLTKLRFFSSARAKPPWCNKNSASKCCHHLVQVVLCLPVISFVVRLALSIVRFSCKRAAVEIQIRTADLFICLIFSLMESLRTCSSANLPYEKKSRISSASISSAIAKGFSRSQQLQHDFNCCWDGISDRLRRPSLKAKLSAVDGNEESFWGPCWKTVAHKKLKA